MRFSRIIACTATGLGLVAAAATGATLAVGGTSSRTTPAVVGPVRPLAVGFQDDPALRWDADRAVMLDQARTAGARVIRTLVTWSGVAPTRPANAADPFDPAYRLGDIDELVREAQARGIDVLVTIWGTPAWANKAAGPNHLPTHLADLTAFAHALSARWSGRYPSYPRVRSFTVWNEPNLTQFLAPQFDTLGRDVAPALYARLYRAAWNGLKAGNPQVLVGIGETSPWGRDRLAGSGVQETHSPARFAELVARADPRLPFDAWAHHPYPTSLGLPPEQLARWPNVSLSALPRFSDRLDVLFHRKNTPIWITEYGYQTRRPAAYGVTAAQQAAYAVRALRLAVANPDVRMFIWFVLRDSASTPWRSGLFGLTGARKPAFAAFAKEAALLDSSNATVVARAGNTAVRLPIEVLALTARNGTGATVGVTWRAYLGTNLVGVNQTELQLGSDGRVTLPVTFTRAPASSYRVVVEIGDINGLIVTRTLKITT